MASGSGEVHLRLALVRSRQVWSTRWLELNASGKIAARKRHAIFRYQIVEHLISLRSPGLGAAASNPASAHRATHQ
jgi:hypothetical protein